MFRWLTENLGWKLVSILLATILWYSVVGDPELVTMRPVPILLRNLPKDLMMASSLPEHVDVEVMGPPSKLAPENFTTAAVLLDLSAINQPGQRAFTLSQNNVTLPQGVRFQRAVPSQLQIQFDRIATREVSVRLRVGQSPPAGYSITKQELMPDKLLISGPESRMRDLAFAYTDPVNLSSVVGETELRVSANVSDPQLRFVTPPLLIVKVTVERTGN
jgi:YbbR domain-containing protein